MANADASLAAPPRGTRPRNRRELILAAASRLFADQGYGQVSISDVASAVNIAPSAIYRHFPGKSALLFDSVAAGLDFFDATVLQAPNADLDGFLKHLATAALDRRRLGVLWQRESRNLPDPKQAELRAHVRTTMHELAVMIRVHREDLTPRQADLLAAGVVAMLTSIAFHRIDVSRTQYETLLEDMARRIITVAPIATSGERKVLRDPLVDRTRRNQLLDAATGLFAARGFRAVSIDDIGHAVGIAGPSLYNHFDSKEQLLDEVFKRGNDMLEWRVEHALTADGGAQPPLRRISDAYVDMALDQSDLIATLVTESRHLNSISLQRTRRIQRDFIDRWVAIARTDGRREAALATRIRVQAAQMVANGLGRTHHLHTIPGFRTLVQELCWTVQQ